MAENENQKNSGKKIRLIFDHDVKRKGKHIIIRLLVKYGKSKTRHKLFIDPEDYPDD